MEHESRNFARQLGSPESDSHVQSHSGESAVDPWRHPRDKFQAFTVCFARRNEKQNAGELRQVQGGFFACTKSAEPVDGYVVSIIPHNYRRLITVIHYAKTREKRSQGAFLQPGPVTET